MSTFLIDENLPVKTNLWNGPDFEFVASLFQSELDNSIWEYARANHLTIVTKDSDFSYRILTSDPPPRVIHIKFGNLRLGFQCFDGEAVGQDPLSFGNS